MNEPFPADDSLDLAGLWRALEELEEGGLDPEEGAKLEALLQRSPAARRAYLEFFQQSAVLRMEAAKLHERGLLPVVGSALQTRRIFQRSIVAAAALVALAAVIAALVAVTRPQPATLAAEVSPQTRWSIDGVTQEPRGEPVEVVEGSVVQVLSGTVRLEVESGDQLVLQGPTEVAFPSPRHPQLRSGWLWIDASKSDDPFEVRASGLRIRDIGTRFGVRVPAGGPVEVHLVEGRVEVLAADDGRVLGDFDEDGTASAVVADGSMTGIELGPDPFPGLPELLGSPSDYRTTVLGQAPVGYWPLDETSGRTLSNLVWDGSPGLTGEGVRGGEPGVGAEQGFGGFPDHNRAHYLDGLPDKSLLFGIDGRRGVKRREGAVSFWIRRLPEAPRRSETLWLAGFGNEELEVPTRAVLHTRLDKSGQVIFEIENGDDDVFLASSRNIADGRWHHVLASWGPSSVDLYIDGRLNARDDQSRILEEARLSGRFVRFGKPSLDLKPQVGSYTGWVDEIALWNRPLTATEAWQQFRSTQGADRLGP